MIVIDSSVWIDYFNGRPTAEADLLDLLMGRALLVIGDLIMTEVLQGFASANQFRRGERIFAALEFRAMAGHAIAIGAAHNPRTLKARRRTPRTTADPLIRTFCVAAGHH